MTVDIDEWVSRLIPQEIPLMRQSVDRLQELRNVADVSAARIVTVVLSDPMMTLKLMRLANVNKSGVFAQRIVTAEHAAMMLGLDSTFNRLCQSPVLEEVLPQPARQGLLRVAARSYHAAMQARDWAVQRLDTNIEEVYIAAMLHEVGEMAMWQADPDLMIRLERTRHKQIGNEAESEILGFSLNALSLALAEQWNMPPLVTSAMQPKLCEVNVRPRCVMLASRLSRHAEWGWYEPALTKDIEEIAEARRLSQDDVIARIHRTASEAARRETFGGVPLAAAWLPMLPGVWPEDSVGVSETIRLSVEEANDAYQEVMDEIARHLDGSLTLHELLVMVMRGMCRGIGFERLVFALLTKDSRTLVARAVVGADEGSPLKGFQFDMDEKNLFSVLMAKPQAIHLTDENRARYAAYLTESIVSTTSGRNFCAMSIGLGGKVIGMFYADGGGVKPDCYDKFKKLCTQAALGMAHLANTKT